MANTAALTKKDDYVKFYTDFSKRHTKEEKERKLIKSFGNGEFVEETHFEDGATFYLEKRHFRETASTSINGLEFTLEIPMIKFEYWTSDSQQHKCYFEKER